MLQNLPLLVLDSVCDNLCFEDVLVLRCTCKSLKDFVDLGKKFTRFNLFVRNFAYYHKLFYTGDYVGYPHSYHSDNLNILASARFRNQFASMQKMIICSRQSWSRPRDSPKPIEVFELDLLNCFTALQHLEIHSFLCLKGKLNFFELRIASFVQQRGDDGLYSSFELNCPKLKALRLRSLCPFLDSNTDKLNYLHISYVSKGYLKRISPNLQKLSTICFEEHLYLPGFSSDLKTGSLSLPSLGEIRLLNCIFLYVYGFDRLVNWLDDLKRNPHTKHIKFIFYDKLIRSPNEIMQIATLIRAYSPSNADSLQIGELWYDFFSYLNGKPELEFLLAGGRRFFLCEQFQLNEETMKKLKCVESIFFQRGCTASDSTFKALVVTSKSLRLLELVGQTITKKRLEGISNHLANLQKIVIRRCKYETLRPLVKFRNLEVISLDFGLPRDELTFIYQNRALEKVYMYFKKTVSLVRTSTDAKLNWNMKNLASGSKSKCSLLLISI